MFAYSARHLFAGVRCVGSADVRFQHTQKDVATWSRSSLPFGNNGVECTLYVAWDLSWSDTGCCRSGIFPHAPNRKAPEYKCASEQAGRCKYKNISSVCRKNDGGGGSSPEEHESLRSTLNGQVSVQRVAILKTFIVTRFLRGVLGDASS